MLLRKLSPRKELEVIEFTSAERGENVTVVACCSASGAFIPPFVIFKGIRFREVYKQDLPAGSDAAMSSSGYFNDDIFLQWLQHFHKHRSCIFISTKKPAIVIQVLAIVSSY